MTELSPDAPTHPITLGQTRESRPGPAAEPPTVPLGLGAPEPPTVPLPVPVSQRRSPVGPLAVSESRRSRPVPPAAPRAAGKTRGRWRLSALVVVAVLLPVGAMLMLPDVRSTVALLPVAGERATPSPGGHGEEAACREWATCNDALVAALTSYEAGGAQFAVALVDNRTGLAFAHLGDRTFETASVVKVSILAALLLQAQDEARELTVEQVRLATRMIGASDNAATDALYAAIGHEVGLNAVFTRLGMSASVPGETWGVTRTTAIDQARLLGALLANDQLFSGYSRTVATELMTAIDSGQAWGINTAATAGERAAFKNGWLSRDTEHGWWIVNSVGRITGEQTDLVLVVLSHGSPNLRVGIGHVETIAAMTREYLAV